MHLLFWCRVRVLVPDEPHLAGEDPAAAGQVPGWRLPNCDQVHLFGTGKYRLHLEASLTLTG